MAEPSGARNISQSLFLLDEKIMGTPKEQLGYQLNNSQMVSDWNSINEPQGIDNQFNAFINQSRIATWYQDNGSAPILLFPNQFGLEPLGGPYNNIPMGSRPGNLLKKGELPKPGYALFGKNQYAPVIAPKTVLSDFSISMNNGIALPSFMDPMTVKQTYGL